MVWSGDWRCGGLGVGVEVTIREGRQGRTLENSNGKEDGPYEKGENFSIERQEVLGPLQ